MTDVLLFDIGLVIVFATVLGYVAKLFKKPMILGYIIAGFVLGPLGLAENVANLALSHDSFDSAKFDHIVSLMGELGVAFLLFIVGLEIDLKKIRSSGIKTVVIATGQIVLTALIGYLIASVFGFSGMAGFYIAIALTFSSTVILIKLLTDKSMLDTGSGRLIIGILLVQDAVAILVLILLPIMGELSLSSIGFSLAKGVLLFLGVILVSKFLMQRIFNFSAKSTELLFLSAISWVLLSSFFAELLDYSVAIGAFLSGVTLASSNYSREIASRIKTLRDFFATVFFVYIGMQLVIPSPGAILGLIAFSLFAIVGKPIIIFLMSRLTGYNNRISLTTGLAMGQISEFSLIIIALGLSLGHINAEISSSIVTATAISIVATAYVFRYKWTIYDFIRNFLKLRDSRIEQKTKKAKYDVILFGYSRLGHSILKKIKLREKSYVVVDFNPDTVRKLKEEKVPVIYGDSGDVEFLKTLNIPEAKMVISTIPEMRDSLLIIEEARKGNVTAIVTTREPETALQLYDQGASYVILPHFIGGKYVSLLLEKFDHLPNLMESKFAHIKELHDYRSKYKNIL